MRFKRFLHKFKYKTRKIWNRMVESARELREICYANSRGKRPLYMELFTMKVSIYVTKLLLCTPIKADQVTISMMLLSIIGSALLATGNLSYMLIGILIIHFTIILDNVNGEIARYRKEDRKST